MICARETIHLFVILKMLALAVTNKGYWQQTELILSSTSEKQQVFQELSELVVECGNRR
jgi:hypothetical protein